MTKKTFLLTCLLGMFASGIHAYQGAPKTDFAFTIEDKKELPFKIKWNTPGNNGKPDQRSLIPEVTLQGYTLHFITPSDGCTFRLVQNNNISYEVEITGNTLTIPTSFTGMYELQIVSGDIIFYTEVEL